jgi:hypothetical protein
VGTRMADRIQPPRIIVIETKVERSHARSILWKADLTLDTLLLVFKEDNGLQI